MVVAWLVLSAVGLLFAGTDAASALRRWIVLADVEDEGAPIRDLAFTTVVAQGTRALLLIIFLTVGVNSLLWESRDLFVVAMFVANAAVVLASIQSWRFRRKLFRESAD